MHCPNVTVLSTGSVFDSSCLHRLAVLTVVACVMDVSTVAVLFETHVIVKTPKLIFPHDFILRVTSLYFANTLNCRVATSDSRVSYSRIL
jgi:hypothetical protein